MRMESQEAHPHAKARDGWPFGTALGQEACEICVACYCFHGSTLD